MRRSEGDVVAERLRAWRRAYGRGARLSPTARCETRRPPKAARPRPSRRALRGQRRKTSRRPAIRASSRWRDARPEERRALAVARRAAHRLAGQSADYHGAHAHGRASPNTRRGVRAKRQRRNCDSKAVAPLSEAQVFEFAFDGQPSQAAGRFVASAQLALFRARGGKGRPLTRGQAAKMALSNAPISAISRLRDPARSPIAQLVEHSTVNRMAAGSSPARGANGLQSPNRLVLRRASRRRAGRRQFRRLLVAERPKPADEADAIGGRCAADPASARTAKAADAIARLTSRPFRRRRTS